MVESLLELAKGYYSWGYVGFLVGAALMVRNLLRGGLSFPLAITAVTASIYGGLVGTRVLFILQRSPRLFLSDPGLALRFWEGGLAWLGGVPLGALGCIIVLLLARKPLWDGCGAIMPGLALAHAISRIGCVINGCCHGAPTTVPWAIHSSVLATDVHPTQIYSMTCELATFLVLQAIWEKRPSLRRYLLPLYGMSLASHRFVTEIFRGTPAGPELISGLRFYQSVCVMMFAASLALALVIWNRKRGGAAATLVIALTVGLFIALAPEPDASTMHAAKGAGPYLVVTRDMFVGALEPWVAHRQAQGHEVVVKSWDPAPDTDEIGQWLRSQSDITPGYVLVVGDCGGADETDSPWHVPSPTRRNQGPPCDALLGDIDGDEVPDVPVGRLPVRDTGRLAAQVDKIIQHERRELTPSWFRGVIWAGAEDYDGPIGAVISRLDSFLPDWLDTFIINASPDSTYGGNPEEQPWRFLEAVADPAMVTAVVSHGSRQSITMADSDGTRVFLCTEDLAKLPVGSPAGPMFLFGCHSGRFDGVQSDGPALAEALLDHPGGPIAVVAATDATQPVTNYLAVLALGRGLSEEHMNVGDLLLGMQRAICNEGNRTLRELASAHEAGEMLLSAEPGLEAEASAPMSGGLERLLDKPGVARSDILTYCLLGDPASPLYTPGLIEVSVTRQSDGKLNAAGRTPEDRAGIVAQLFGSRPDDRALATDLAPAERRKAFENANSAPITLWTGEVEHDGTWSMSVGLPEGGDARDRLRFLVLGRNRAHQAVCAMPEDGEASAE